MLSAEAPTPPLQTTALFLGKWRGATDDVCYRPGNSFFHARTMLAGHLQYIPGTSFHPKRLETPFSGSQVPKFRGEPPPKNRVLLGPWNLLYRNVLGPANL